MRIEITEMGVDPKLYFRNALLEAHKQALMAVGAHWAEKMLPTHFEPQAPKRYNYKGRSRNYVRIRDRRGGGPLRLTGKLREATRNKPRITLRKNILRVHISGLPVYVDQRRIADQDLYRERIQKAIAQGKDVEKNKRRLEKLKKSTNSARYPNIKAELVKTLKDEAEALAVVYRRTGRHALRDNPKAKKKTHRVRKS